MEIEIIKLEAKITEKSLTEIILSENKEQFEKEKINSFEIKILKDKFEITGKKGLSIFNIPFIVSGSVKKASETKAEIEFEKVKFLFLLSISSKRLVDEILKNNPKGICRGKENSILLEITNLDSVPLKIKIKDLKLEDGYVILKA